MRLNRLSIIAIMLAVCIGIMALVASNVTADGLFQASLTETASPSPESTLDSSPVPSEDPADPTPIPTDAPVDAEPNADGSDELSASPSPESSPVADDEANAQGPSPYHPELAQTFCQLAIGDAGDNNPFTYQFSASVANNIDSFAWDFGDGNTATTQNAPHTYTSTGSFTVSLICTPLAGFGAPMTLTGSITINSPVAALFSLSPAAIMTGMPPYTVGTINQSTGGGLSYAWKISDSANPLDPGIYTATTENISYNFNPAIIDLPETYWFHLTVTDGAGTTASAAHSVVFNPPPPKATFTLTPIVGPAPHTITVEGVDLGEGPITVWEWDFDNDGLVDATGQGPHNYVFNTPGTYPVTLTYSGPGGSGGTVMREVGVSPSGDPVNAIFNYEITGNNIGGIEVCFTNESTGPVATSTWDFGDGTIVVSNDAVVCHSYSGEMVVTVFLYVQNDTGDSTSDASSMVNVVQAPTAHIAVTPGTTIYWGTLINLSSAGSTGLIDTYEWDYNGDGLTDSTAANPTGLNLAIGIHTIRLTVTGPGGQAHAEAIIYVERLNVTCDFTGPLTVVPTAGAQSYSATVGSLNGRTPTYEWTITGNGVGLPMTFTTPTINVDWAAIGTGSFQVSLKVSAPDSVDCIVSKTVVRTWEPLNCAIMNNLPTTVYATGNTYQFTANTSGTQSRTVTAFDWYVDGVAQGINTTNFNWTVPTTTVGLPDTVEIRYSIQVDNGDGTFSDCYEVYNVTIQPWPTLTCNNITGQASPWPVTPDDPARTYNYTANIGGLQGRSVSYQWTVVDGTVTSPNPRNNNNQATVRWNASASSLAPAPSNDNISVVVTVTNPDGTTVNCNMNRNVAVTVPRLTCNLPVGDVDPVVGEIVNYATNIDNILGRPEVAFTWTLEQWDGVAWNVVASGTTPPMTYLFDEANAQYRLRYTYSVGAVGDLVGDNCVSNWLPIETYDVGVSFQCDTTTLVGNLAPSTAPGSYTYTFVVDNGNPLPLDYRWVVIDTLGVEHELAVVNDLTTDGTITSPVFTLADLSPLGIDINTLRVYVTADPASTSYACEAEAVLTVGTLNVNYSFTGNNMAMAINEQTCLTNISTATPGDIDSLAYTWTVSGPAGDNSWNASTSTDQQPGCISWSVPGAYTVTLYGENPSTLRNGTQTYTFHVYGLQSIVLSRSTQVFGPANVTFTATPTNVGAPYAWQFIRLSDNSVVNSYNSPNNVVTQAFPPGQYRAIVSANGPLGTTSASLEFELIDTDQLRAAFTPSVYGGLAPLTVCFTDNSVSNSPITYWEWDFDGDGNWDLDYGPGGAPDPICFTYTAPGQVYSARLRVTNANFSNTATNPIRTYNLVEASATFTIEPQGGGYFCFTAVLDGPITVVGWDFGDGSTGPADLTVCHQYSSDGTFLVTLYVTDGTETGEIVRPVVVDLSNSTPPVLSVNGICGSDRTAVFTISNAAGAGDMTTPDLIVVRDNGGNIIFSDGLLLNAGEQRVVSIPNQSGTVSISLTDAATVSTSVTCNYPPEITITASCNVVTHLPVFTVTNARPTDGPMAAPQDFEIRDSLGNLIVDDSFFLTVGVTSVDIEVPAGNNPYETYTLTSNGAVGNFNLGQSCAPQPTLTIDGVCAAEVSFTITNTSSNDMVLPQTFTIVDGSSTDVTPTGNSFQLDAGESVTITLTGLTPYESYTFTSNGFAGNLSLTQNCASPTLVVTAVCSASPTFNVVNNGSDMLGSQAYTVTDSLGAIVASGSIALNSGEDMDIVLTGLDPYASYTFNSTGFAGTLNLVSDCDNPDLSVSSTCSYPIAFTVTNNGDDMLTPQAYTITDNSNGNVVASGTLDIVGSGAFVTIELTGLDPYVGYTINSSGFAGSITLSQDCTRPVLVGSSTCSDPATFIIENQGGDMLTPQTFSIAAEDGSDATPTSNSFQLNAGEQTVISLTGLNPYAGYTLSSADFAGILHVAQNCNNPILVVTASCDLPAAFTVTNIGGDMLTSHNYTLLTGGVDVTPAGNSFQLNAGESVVIPVPAGVDAHQAIEFVSNDLGIIGTATMFCPLAVAELPPTGGNTSGFSGLPASLDAGISLPTWDNVAVCGYSCPPFRLYHSDETGDWEIFRLDGADANNRETFRVNISQGIGEGIDDMAPSMSPNAKWVAFTSNRDGNWEIYVAPLTDDAADQALGIQRLTYNTVAIDTDPVWGPNNYVVYETTRHGHWDLYMVDMRTGEEYRLTDNEADDINPFWSPDGSKFVFQSNRDGLGWQVYEYSLANATLRRLSDGSAIDVDPQYSHDGRQIVFRRYASNNTQSQIMLMDANGENVKAVTGTSEDATNPAWSPDDRLIAYQSDADGDLDIYIYEVATGSIRQLTNNDIDDYAPTWWCAGDRVIFTSDVAGNPDIYEANATPISDPAILVEEAAEQMTFEDSQDVYPQVNPAEENASREGQTVAGVFGEQTTFLRPASNLTPIDLSSDGMERDDWKALETCPRN